MRTLVLAALSLTVAPHVGAQASVGVRLGLNAATVSDQDLLTRQGKRSRLGLAVGVVADVPVTPLLSFRPEVLYVQRGVTFDSLEPRGSGSLTQEYDYLDVPLMLGYRFPAPGALRVTAEAGPVLSYLVRSGTSCSGEVTGCDDPPNVDYQSGDVSAAVGVTAGVGPFSAGLRYTHGFVPLAEDRDPKNRAVTAAVRYRIGL